MTVEAQKQEKKLDVKKLINQAINEAVKKTVLLGFEHSKTTAKNVFKQTEVRLFAYPELKKNIEKYHLDINDLRKESPGKSKDITVVSIGGAGIRLTADEVQEGRIRVVQAKMYRDQKEIEDIDFALQAVINDEYYKIIEMRYFENLKDDDIAPVVNCDPSTVRRNKNRLIRRIAVKLYGAEAVS